VFQGGAEGVQRAGDDLRGLRDRELPSAGEHRRQALPLEEFHHEVRGAVRCHAHVVDVDDPAMADGRRGLRLAEEALDDLLVADDLGVEKLHRAPAVDEDVLGLVDRAHPPFAEQPGQAVPALENLPDPLCRHSSLRRRTEMPGHGGAADQRSRLPQGDPP
jgi:hypothetical protein